MAKPVAKTDHAVETTAAHVETSAEHSPASIWQSADTWLFVSFFLFVAIFVKYVLPHILKGLDGRAATIRNQLEQANRLRTEAQELLKTYKKQQDDALNEAEAIIATAQSHAVAIREQAEADLKQTLERRMQQAQEKIARAEAEAISHIRTRIIDLATESAREILAEQAKGAADDEAISRAISAVEQQIH